MDPAQRIYRGAVRTLSFAFVAIGLALLVSTLTRGGGPAALGVVLGIGFIGVGVARLWLSGLFRGLRGREHP